MLIPTLSTLLPVGSNGTISTVPQASDIAQWITLPILVGCIVGPEAVTAAADSASHLITVIVVLLLVRSQVRRPSRDACQAVH
ncbi:hypothetical protein [Streptomyces sp. NPDC048202]|uniref:hypothetical protein n=1 Tax=Streptomyces sp. NPDC048202 TaxID=3365514 RepID=UPI0037241133